MQTQSEREICNLVNAREYVEDEADKCGVGNIFKNGQIVASFEGNVIPTSENIDYYLKNMALVNKLSVFILLLLCSCKLYADENLWSFPINTKYTRYYELKEVLNDFLVKNDSSAYEQIIYARNTNPSYCFYESEYFMYSLMMAIDYKSNVAYSELNRLLSKFYEENHLIKGKFATDLSDFFQGKGEILSQEDFKLTANDTLSFLFVERLKRNFGKGNITSEFLRKIIFKGDSLSYSILLDSLENKCSSYDRRTDFYNYGYVWCKLLFYSIYHIDKNNSSYGYYSLYSLIREFYAIAEKEPSDDMVHFALYFLTKSKNMGNKRALQVYKELSNSCDTPTEIRYR